MSRTKPRVVSARKAAAYKPRISRGLPTNARLSCADNTGAKILRLITVDGYKTRLRRIPAACIGEMVKISVIKGPPDLRRQVIPAVIVRQKKPYRRKDGSWIQFEDNAAILMNPEGDVKGTEIRGPIAREAAERWPRVAAVANIII